MEKEEITPNPPLNPIKKISKEKDKPLRSKTPLRISYESEVKLICKKIGSIEKVREDLGLSRRKMCQLLLVDPSAWTRWNKQPEQIPPHIYRSLQWYLALIEKQPEWHPKNTYLGAYKETQYQIKKMEKQWEEKLQESLPPLKKATLTQEELLPLYEKNQIFNEKLACLIHSQRNWRFLLFMNTVILIFICAFIYFFRS